MDTLGPRSPDGLTTSIWRPSALTGPRRAPALGAAVPEALVTDNVFAPMVRSWE